MEPRNIVILIGMAGSGKGTQAKKLVEIFNWQWMEMGSFIRARAAKTGSEGAELTKIINAGKHLPPQIPLKIFAEDIAPLASGETMLLDGFPRTGTQDRLLWDWCRLNGWPTPRLAIHLKTDLAVVLPRLIARSKTKIFPSPQGNYQIGQTVKREDDYIEAIQERVQYFTDHAPAIIDWYRYQDKLIEVNGEQAIERVSAELLEKLNNYIQRHHLGLI